MAAAADEWVIVVQDKKATQSDFRKDHTLWSKL